jgi:PAS domain-containing protein
MGEGLTLSLAGFLALLAAVVTAWAIIALKRYFRHRLAVDARYKAIIDQANDGIVIVDSEQLGVQYCNPAFLARIRYSGAEAGDLTLAELFADAESTPESVLARMRADFSRPGKSPPDPGLLVIGLALPGYFGLKWRHDA